MLVIPLIVDNDSLSHGSLMGNKAKERRDRNFYRNFFLLRHRRCAELKPWKVNTAAIRIFLQITRFLEIFIRRMIKDEVLLELFCWEEVNLDIQRVALYYVPHLMFIQGFQRRRWLFGRSFRAPNTCLKPFNFNTTFNKLLQFPLKLVFFN